MIIQIPLTRGMFALVDECDYALVNAFKWYAKEEHGLFYAIRTVCGGKCSMHRMIMLATREIPVGMVIDHKNRNGLDNRRDNLRLATPAQNNFNRTYKRKSRSKLRGVVWHEKLSKWQAQIKCGRKNFYLGLFGSAAEAAIAYDAKAREMFGEFARLNFPRPAEQRA